MEFSRPERKMLRGLAGDVYEAEARELLEELDAAFDLWRQGEKLSSELLTDIHEFHQHQSRELWSMYQTLDEATIVARGIGFGLIPEDEVPQAIREKLNVSFWAGRG
jgi:hypothetical protein